MEKAGDITEGQLAGLVAHFYAAVRADPELGPIFNAAVSDWDEHLRKLTSFWSSVVLGTQTYRGNPMAAHLKHADAITPALFVRWLDLWNKATASLFPPALAHLLQAKASRIAESLQLGLRFRPGSNALARS